MTSKTYTIAWDKCIENCLEVSSQLAAAKLDYIFYNVSEKYVDWEGWVRAEDIRYYGHFYNSLKDFKESKHSVFIFNAGDASYDDFAGFTRKTEKLFKEDKSIGAYAPSIYVDAFSNFELARSEKHPELYLTCMTNGIYLALSREIALATLDFLDWAFSKGYIKNTVMKSGWGLDVAYCSLVIYLNKKIYRDDIVFTHPEGSSYGTEASSEYDTVIKSFLEYCSEIGLDVEAIKLIQENTIKSVTASIEDKPKLSDFYSDTPKGLAL